MKASIWIKLSAMMFLEFFIWGAWFVTMGTYLMKGLHATGTQNATAYLTQAFGAILAPFVVGLIADKYVSAQKILGVLHLAGALLMYYITKAGNFDQFYPIILAYMIIYMPTIALANSVAFKQLANPNKQFPFIRVFGTAGWMIAGLIIAYFDWEHKGTLVLTFQMTAIASLILGVFSFMLPDTPPAKKGQKVSVGEIMGLEAIGLLKRRSFLVFFLASVAICIPLAFYYNFTNDFLNEVGMKKAAGVQAIGQFSELFFMAAMPFFFVRLGVKKMLAIGMLAWALRYLFFAYGDSGDGYWLLVAGIALHGICYDFFFVIGQIYTENHAGERFKSSAQGFITLATYGVGMLAWALRYLFFAYGDSGDGYWLLVAGIALHGICYDFFFVIGQIYTENHAGERFKSSAQGFITLATYGVGMLIGYIISGPIVDHWRTGEASHDWKSIWLIPGAIALVVMLIFVALFRDKEHTEMKPGLDIEEPSPQVDI